MKRNFLSTIVVATVLATTSSMIPVNALPVSAATQENEAKENSLAFTSKERCVVLNTTGEKKVLTAKSSVVVYTYQKDGKTYKPVSNGRKEYKAGEKINVYNNNRVVITSSSNSEILGELEGLNISKTDNTYADSFMAGNVFTLRVGDTLDLNKVSLAVPRGSKFTSNFTIASSNTKLVQVVEGMKIKAIASGSAKVNVTDPSGAVVPVTIKVINPSEASPLDISVSASTAGVVNDEKSFNFTINNAIGMYSTRVEYRLKGEKNYVVGASTLYEKKRTVKFSKAGTYEWRAIATDLRGKEVVKTGEITIRDMKLDAGTVIVETTEGLVGTSQTIKSTATGDGQLQYKFIVTDGKGNYMKIRDYSSEKSCTWNMTSKGTKYVYCVVKNSVGKEVESTRKKIEVKEDVPIEISSLTCNKQVAVKGTEVTLRANASGGSTEKLYRFECYDVNADGRLGKSYVLQDYSSNSTLKRAFNATGMKMIRVLVKNANGVGTVAQKDLKLPVTDKEQPYIANVTCDSKTIEVGKTVELATEVYSNTSTTYKFVEKDPSGTYTVISGGTNGFSSSKTVNWTPKKAGTYSIIVHAKNSAGVDVSKVVTYKVVVPTINGKLDVSVTGSSYKGLKLSATNVSGGSKYKYSYSVMVKSGDKEYTSVIYSGTDASTVYYPSQAGRSFKFKLVITDTVSGVSKTVYTDYKTYNVASEGNAGVYNKEGKETTTGTVDEPLTIKYQYNPPRFTFGYIVKDASGKIVASVEKQKTNIMTWTPTKAGKYTIQIKAASFENNVNTVTKTITVGNYDNAEITAKYNYNGKVGDATENKFVPKYEKDGDSVTFTLTGVDKDLLSKAKISWTIKDASNPNKEYPIGNGVGKTSATTSCKVSGDKIVTAKISDADGSNEVVKEFKFTVNKSLELSGVTLINKGVAVDPSELIANKEYSVRINIASENGRITGFGTKKYTLVVVNPNGEKTKIKENYSSNTITWTPNMSGKWKIEAYAEDSVKSVANVIQEVNVRNADTVTLKGVTMKSKLDGVSKTSFSENETIVFTPQLEYNGTPKISYKYKYVKTDVTPNQSGTLHGTEFINERTYERAFKSAGKYDITVEVYSNGELTDSITKSIVINKDLSNITVQGPHDTEMVVGTSKSFSITANVSNSSTKYRYVLKNTSTGELTYITATADNPEGWVSKTGITYTFNKPGTYTMICQALSSTGTKVSKNLNNIKVISKANIDKITVEGMSENKIDATKSYKVTMNVTGNPAYYTIKGNNIATSVDGAKFTSKTFTIQGVNAGKGSFTVTAYSSTGIKLCEMTVDCLVYMP